MSDLAVPYAYLVWSLSCDAKLGKVFFSIHADLSFLMEYVESGNWSMRSWQGGQTLRFIPVPVARPLFGEVRTRAPIVTLTGVSWGVLFTSSGGVRRLQARGCKRDCWLACF